MINIFWKTINLQNYLYIYRTICIRSSIDLSLKLHEGLLKYFHSPQKKRFFRTHQNLLHRHTHTIYRLTEPFSHRDTYSSPITVNKWVHLTLFLPRKTSSKYYYTYIQRVFLSWYVVCCFKLLL